MQVLKQSQQNINADMFANTVILTMGLEYGNFFNNFGSQYNLYNAHTINHYAKKKDAHIEVNSSELIFAWNLPMK